ncbi:hypothetical protein GQ43DRAFT_433866 [Delitschia confertaspora ATCC 74209]|uniref:Uncharacterized protein n=1 Tax=Delitschia confertaspora ATCC 74209 TaxID=1513339 RepID=A0A9P4JIW3_9PLEO|nr:hypothetical protein GQ43DRAFT_433866 [Delitschia confertaspora ATCC 74209]
MAAITLADAVQTASLYARKSSRKKSKGKKIKGGTIAGIVIAIIVVLIILAFLFLLYKRQQKKKREKLGLDAGGVSGHGQGQLAGYPHQGQVTDGGMGGGGQILLNAAPMTVHTIDETKIDANPEKFGGWIIG